MSSFRVVGTIVDKDRKSKVQWIISPGPLRSWQEDEYLQSPPFHLLRSSWYLRFYPNDSNVFACLERDALTNQEFPLTLRVRFDIYYNRCQFPENIQKYTFYQSNQICKMPRDDYDYSFPSSTIGHFWSRTVDRFTKIECSMAEECTPTMDESFCTRKYSYDFENLLMNRQNSDVSIAVKGMTYPAHKLILKARSPVFDRMFTHDMRENKDDMRENKGNLDLNEYDVRTVCDFLKFLYTGKLNGCTSYQNAEGLYKLANKYDVKDLKERSRQLIEQNMSEDSACDILNLAEIFTDSLLKESAKLFVKSQFHKIFHTKRWGEFLVRNKLLATEIWNEVIYATKS